MTLRDLVGDYGDDPRVTALAQALADDQDLVMGAVHGGLTALLAAAMARAPGGRLPPLIVGHDPESLVDDLDELGLEAMLLPTMDEYDDESTSQLDVRGFSRRVAALQAALRGVPLVASPQACDQPVPDRRSLTTAVIEVACGQRLDIHDLCDRMVDAGYRVSALCEDPGDISVRGGIIDVFPLAADLPVRIEFFDDEIDTIRRFDPDSQESVARLRQVRLSAGTGMVANQPLWQVLPPGPVMVLADVPLRRRLKTDPARRELRLARLLEPGSEDGASVGVERFKGDARHDLAELAQAAGEGAVLVLARNEESRRDLVEHCHGQGLDQVTVTIGRLHAGFRDLERNLLVVHDFELSHRRPIKRRRDTVRHGAPLSSLADLKPKDYVVHLNHGIARFVGMAALEKGGYMEDHLLLEFAEQARLYIPVTGIDLIQKYIGGAGRHPPLTRLGGSTWRRRTEKARAAVADISAELLATQAQRSTVPAPILQADPAVMRRFEAGFPFEETQDQLQAAREIRQDLASSRPMDRLLCGDVGFGKTEIAMRAAMHAVASGVQVAVLAPTTILAEQHATTFEERFADSPYRIGCLNRFRNSAERRTILEAVRHGDLHILIGTHALLTEDLAFAGLGLLIVDEEQRFGVKHKERLKAMAQGVHVLTLSATPIPRTLHMSLLGLRGISVLGEAPAERLGVQTTVTHWDKALIRTILERELERDGQIFVVHDRIASLDAFAARLARLMPAMRLACIHGRMDERDIARIMRDFQRGGIDCLVATSIIESGLDIPNANTLIVHNAQSFGLAELHQIRGRIGRFTRQAYAYFLIDQDARLNPKARERLDAIQEYAELGAGFKLAMRDMEMRGAGNLLGAEQSGQIEAIGYELYCRLLAEAIRSQGAAQVGLDDDPATGHPRPVVNLGLSAYIPDDYLEAATLKFNLHKDLDACRTTDELQALARRTRDRYGPLPETLRHLFITAVLRLRCRSLGITRLEIAGPILRLHLADSLPPELATLARPDLVAIDSTGSMLRLRFDHELDPALVLDLLQIDLAWLPGASLPEEDDRADV